jgi:hypothetical protein
MPPAAPRLTTRLASLAILAACSAPPTPRGRYTLLSVDGRNVPIDASFYTPAVGYTSDLVGGDLLVCSPTLVVRTDRVREQNTVVPVDDPRATPHESWMTEPMAVRRDGRHLYLAHTTAHAPPAPLDSGTVLGSAGDTITIDQHAERAAAPTRRYLFARAAGDTADQGHAGTLCAGYMRGRAP